MVLIFWQQAAFGNTMLSDRGVAVKMPNAALPRFVARIR